MHRLGWRGTAGWFRALRASPAHVQQPNGRYLEDLWVDPAARGTGIGRKLIETLIARSLDQGWRRVYWHTEADNAAARALYDRIAVLTPYVRYDVVPP